MKRTRKWAYVAQEAKRLADLGLSPGEIAKRLEVERRSVDRWMAAGKLNDTRRSAARRAMVAVESPGEWAESVRAAYALDATDEELVKMGSAALQKAHDPLESVQVRLSAMGRFQALVKQLALVARSADISAQAPPRPARPMPKRGSSDPRAVLTAVK